MRNQLDWHTTQFQQHRQHRQRHEEETTTYINAVTRAIEGFQTEQETQINNAVADAVARAVAPLMQHIEEQDKRISAQQKEIVTLQSIGMAQSALRQGDRKEAERILDAFVQIVVERGQKGILYINNLKSWFLSRVTLPHFERRKCLCISNTKICLQRISPTGRSMGSRISYFATRPSSVFYKLLRTRSS